MSAVTLSASQAALSLGLQTRQVRSVQQWSLVGWRPDQPELRPCLDQIDRCLVTLGSHLSGFQHERWRLLYQRLIDQQDRIATGKGRMADPALHRLLAELSNVLAQRYGVFQVDPKTVVWG